MADGLLAARLTAQLLSGPPAGDPVAVAERLLAIQGQDPRGARLAVRARSAGLSAADVDRALTDDRSLLITWLNRGTLHLVRSEDYPLLQVLTTARSATGNLTRLAQMGVDRGLADRGVATIERALAAEGPLTRAELRDRLDPADVPTAGQILVHLLMRASLQGVCVRGPMKGREHAYALVRDWLPPSRLVERDAALAELARRYLAGHGPADDRDLARWAGIGLVDARRALRAIARHLVERPDGLVDLPRSGEPAAIPGPRLLGAYEPVLLGWVDRTPLLGEHVSKVTVEGLFRSFAMVAGRAAATWRLERGRVSLEPFRPIGPDAAAALDADAHDVGRFLAT
jgi:Winged helix DNA-binding domain